MLPTTYKAYLRKEIAISGSSNALFNGLICWYLIKNKKDLSWWGDHSFGVDILATGFILPWIVALIVIPLQRSKVRKGKLASWTPAAQASTLLERLVIGMPTRLWLSSLTFGAISLLGLAPLTLLGLWAAGISTFTPAEYALFKGIWAGLLASLLIVPMVLTGLRADCMKTQVSIA